MNLRTLLHGKAWNDPALVWPIRRTLPLRSTPLPAKVRGTAPAWDTFVKYNELMNPAVDEDNTNLGCCAIENGSKPVEVDYARDTKTYAPLRHAEIYQKLLFMINGNDKDSGFELLEAMNGLKALGIIKPDTAIEEVELAEGAIQTALQRGPLVWGVIASGIMPQELSADGLGWAD
ncbi:MAG: hypothetical protein NTY53_17050, partial [Kiritimatiellaeota bacterium]|nr:hypothetical protein [Kiritimatiellota bacterium]